MKGGANRKLYPRFWQPTYLLNRAIARSLGRVAEKMSPANSERVLLDVGCGVMPYRELFEPLVTSYVGCDMYPSVEGVVACPADDMPFKEKAFDVIVCFQVLEHVPDPWRVVVECARVLKPGGLLVLTAPFAYPYHPSPNDYYRFSHQGLEEICRRAGLETIDSESQCGTFQTLVLQFNIMIVRASTFARRSMLTVPLGWLGIWILVPAMNVVARSLVAVLPNSKNFKSMQTYSNLMLVARRPVN